MPGEGGTVGVTVMDDRKQEERMQRRRGKQGGGDKREEDRQVFINRQVDEREEEGVHPFEDGGGRREFIQSGGYDIRVACQRHETRAKDC